MMTKDFSMKIVSDLSSKREANQFLINTVSARVCTYLTINQIGEFKITAKRYKQDVDLGEQKGRFQGVTFTVEHGDQKVHETKAGYKEVPDSTLSI